MKKERNEKMQVSKKKLSKNKKKYLTSTPESDIIFIYKRKKDNTKK